MGDPMSLVTSRTRIVREKQPWARWHGVFCQREDCCVHLFSREPNEQLMMKLTNKVDHTEISTKDSLSSVISSSLGFLRWEAAWMELLGLDPAVPFSEQPKRAFCISLKESDTRMEAMSERFHEVGLCRLMTFYRPDRALRSKRILFPAKYGCWTSHQEVLKQFVDECSDRDNEHENKHCLVFEDDIEFRISDPLDLHAVAKDLRPDNTPAQKQQWSLVKLGQHTIRGIPLIDSGSTLKGVSGSHKFQMLPRLWNCNSYLTHALLWSAVGARQFLATSFESVSEANPNVDLDVWMNRAFSGSMLAVFPQMVVQNPRFESQINHENGWSLAKWFRLTHWIQFRWCNFLDFGALVLQPLALGIAWVLIFFALARGFVEQRGSFQVHLVRLGSVLSGHKGDGSRYEPPF